MKIPKYIENKMRRALELYQKANFIMCEIEDYLAENCKVENIDNILSPWRSGNGISLEELEYGNDIIDEFVKWAESDFENLI